MRSNWSLFLDRDGVINELIPLDYVKSTQEFVFKEDALKELAHLSQIFDHIFIVTNQQGVGKGLMTAADLDEVHNYMLDEIKAAGGRITRIYSCIHLKDVDCDCRKPNPGMLIQAFEEFPQSNPKKSIVVGDSSSDIEMAHSLNIPSVGMLHTYNIGSLWNPQPQYLVNNLTELRLKVLPLILGTD